jgi:hypothetical protein
MTMNSKLIALLLLALAVPTLGKDKLRTGGLNLQSADSTTTDSTLTSYYDDYEGDYSYDGSEEEDDFDPEEWEDFKKWREDKDW